MKDYRYAPLWAVLWVLVASLTKILAYFDMSVDNVNGNSALSASVSVEQMAEVEQKAVDGLAASASKKTTTTKATWNNAVCAGYNGYISVGGKNICLQSTSETGGNLSYRYAYIYNSSAYNSFDSYIFGHNSAELFGGLKNLGLGTQFAVTLGGKTTNYRISEKTTYCDYSNPSHPCANYVEPVLDMQDVIWPERKGAGIAIMTCAGAAIGNGDATHRLVVFGERI